MKYNINAKLITVISCLYDNASSALYNRGSIGEWLRTSVGVRQGCLLSATLFNIFLEKIIMADALEDNEGKISIGGRTITNLRLADDIDGLAGEEQELVNLIERRVKASTAFGMEISVEKTRLTTNNTNGISTEIKVGGEKLETVKCFKYHGTVVSDEGCKPGVLARIAQTTAALTKLRTIWNDRNITICTKIRLMCSLNISVYMRVMGLGSRLERRIHQATEVRYLQKILGISWRDHVTNEEVQNRAKKRLGPTKTFFPPLKRENSGGTKT